MTISIGKTVGESYIQTVVPEEKLGPIRVKKYFWLTSLKRLGEERPFPTVSALATQLFLITQGVETTTLS